MLCAKERPHRHRKVIVIFDNGRGNDYPDVYFKSLAGKPLLSHSLESAASVNGQPLLITPSEKVAEFSMRRGFRTVLVKRDGHHRGNLLREIIVDLEGLPIHAVAHVATINPRYPFLSPSDIREAFHMSMTRGFQKISTVTPSEKSIWHYHTLGDGCTSARLVSDNPAVRYRGFRQEDRALYVKTNALRMHSITVEDSRILHMQAPPNKSKTFLILDRISGFGVFSKEAMILAEALYHVPRTRRC